jgi:acetylornithine deacetylase/succinyl-diaminopimelate desuccinylase-like protein
MTRAAAVARALAAFDDGRYLDDLARRVAIPTESQNPERLADLERYLTAEMVPAFEAMGFACRRFENPVPGAGPVLLAERLEDPAAPTVLGYGHGDVIRGYDDQWHEGLSPWRTRRRGDRLYGRGTADNKGQHSLNMRAMEAVLEQRGRLGFNAKFMIEMGEENGSAGLKEIIEANLEAFAADVFIASDGPRVAPGRPTLFLGARGAKNFDLVVELRDGGHHSGNWGGLLANPGIILAHALATIVSASGRILVEDWLPPPLSDSVRAALADIVIDGGEGAPEIDPDWGEPGMTPAEKVYGWNSFEVLAFKTGNPENPVNAIPPRARAHCQIRFVAGSRREDFLPALRRHLDARGFAMVAIEPPPAGNAIDFAATRTEPDHPWAVWAAAAIERTTGRRPAVLPSLGGSICNDLFTDTLGLPAIWIPHSYASCSQHAPNEHVLLSLLRDAMAVMAGLYWDLGDPASGLPAGRGQGRRA